MFGLKDILKSPDSLEGTTGISDDVKFLEQEDEQPPADAATPEVEEKEEEVVEETEEEREEREASAKPRELLPHERPTLTDIKEAFPDLFKKFPVLRDVLFREKAFNELFSSIEDARTAQDDSVALQEARQSIFNDDGSGFLAAVKKTDEAALLKFASNIMPALYKVDEKAHWAAANPLMENMVKAFAESAPGNEDTKKAALLMAKFLFGNDAQDILDGKKSYVPRAAESKTDPERVKFESDRLKAFTGDISSDIKGQVKSVILSKDKNGSLRLDPEGVFSRWMVDTLVEKINKEVDDQMGADREHLRYMDSLWSKAKKDGYTSDWKSRITSAYLARARQLVPAVRAKIVAEANGTSQRRAARTKEVVDGVRRGTGSPARESRNSSGITGRIDYNKTSDDDIINDNITYRK